MIASKKEAFLLEPHSTMARAYLLMEKLNCDILPVKFRGEVVGVLSMRDIQNLAFAYAQGGFGGTSLTVGKFMKSPVTPVEGTKNLAEVIRTMLIDNTYAVVVKEGDKVLGVLCRDHLLLLLAQLSEKSKDSVLDTLKRVIQPPV